MRVKELIAELQKYDENMDVVISCDPEGNYFETIDDLDYMFYYIPEDEYLQGYDEEDLEAEEINPEAVKKVVVIWP